MSDFVKDINVPANDCISRQAAIDAVFNNAEHPDKAYGAIRHLPSAQPEYRLDEWCTDCKEYDTERHCCPRFNQVIRTTLNEMKSERKKGKWIRNDNNTWSCDQCRSWIPDEQHYYARYCLCCGAKMEENV